MDVKLTGGPGVRAQWEELGGFDTYRKYVRWLDLYQRFDEDAHREAEHLAEEVFKRRPTTAVANRMLAWQHMSDVSLGLSTDRKKSMAGAYKHAEAALAIDEGDALSHVLKATLDLYRTEHDIALRHAERALELAPAAHRATALAGFVAMASGRPEEGVRHMRLAMRNEPDHPQWIPGALAMGLRMTGSNEEAKALAHRLLASPVEDARAHGLALGVLAAIAEEEGNELGAREYVARMVETDPRQSSSREALKRRFYYLKDQAFLDRMLGSLRRAGLPEGGTTKPSGDG